jgi:hypothetical protein
VSEDTERRRAELRRHWELFIDGSESAATTAEWAQDQLADYGEEEIIHQGLQSLNDHSWRGLPATHATWVSYQDWLEVVHWYDDDPDAWNYNYWRNFLVGMVAGCSTVDAARIGRGLADYLDDSTIQLIVDAHANSE